MEYVYYIDFVNIFTSVVVVSKKISFLFISHSLVGKIWVKGQTHAEIYVRSDKIKYEFFTGQGIPTTKITL